MGDLLLMSGMSNLTCLRAGPLLTLYRGGGGEVNVRRGGLGRRGVGVGEDVDEEVLSIGEVFLLFLLILELLGLNSVLLCQSASESGLGISAPDLEDERLRFCLFSPLFGLVLSVTKGKAGELEEVSAFWVGSILVRPLCGLSGDGVRSLEPRFCLVSVPAPPLRRTGLRGTSPEFCCLTGLGWYRWRS